jgi:transposase
MANTTISMNKLRQIIRLHAQGQSQRQIAKMLHVHRATVRDYIGQLLQSGLSHDDLLSMDDEQLNRQFTKPPMREIRTTDPARIAAMREFFPYMTKELGRVGVDKLLLWMEYKEKYPTGYAYSHFCREYRRWSNKQQASMHFEHKAGEKMFIDFTGKKLQLVCRESGQINEVEVFVAVLGFSHYTYVEAIEDQSKEAFIAATENALRYFGGVPQAIVPDNLKAAVTRASRYEPTINETFEDFALHYGTTILPARPHRPKDKSIVEGGVNIIYKRIFAPLRDLVFYELSSLNEAIQDLLDNNHNAVDFKGKTHSRRSLFTQVEQVQLSPLAVSGYEIKYFKWLHVHKTAHIFLTEDRHYYSVPFRYIGDKVKMIYTRTTVEIYCRGERIAHHKRSTRSFGYTTVKDHMPSAHQFVSDWSSEKFITWAKGIGQETGIVIETIIQSRVHPEQGYKSCAGILSFAKRVGKERLNNACKRAISYQSCNYNSIKSILEKGLDQLQTRDELFYKPLPAHENIRGKEYYQ